MDLIELSRRLENLIRIGTIDTVDHTAVRCRVKTGRLITNWLRWHTLRAGDTRTWDPPTVGEQCIVLSPSGEPANGVVLYGLNGSVKAPSASPDKHRIEYPDGAYGEYDHERHTYLLDVPAAGSITLRCGSSQIVISGSRIGITSGRIDLN